MMLCSTRSNRYLQAALLPLVLASCGSEIEAPQPVELTSTDEMYSDQHVPRLDLELDAAALTALELEPREYVRATFIHGETRLENIGVRLKGSASFDDLSGKPSLKIQFNEFVSGQKFLGLKNLTLHNMKQDATKLRERLSYQIFRAAGVQAPRTGYADLYINGEDYGIFLNIETIDDIFLDRNFADGDGDLYEGDYGDDLHSTHVERFEHDEGDDIDRIHLADFVDYVHLPGDAIFYDETTPLDTDTWLTYSAVEAVVGHWDGYWIAHNYRIYHEPTLDQWYFIPWGTDQTFWQTIQPFEQLAYLTRKCLGLEPCLVDYVERTREIVTLLEEQDLREQIGEVRELIDDRVFADPRSHHPNNAIESSRNSLNAYLDRRPGDMMSWLDCVEDGREVDADMDGYGRCFADCDDDNSAVYPTRTEICDGVDNNCSGNIDDALQCPCEEADIGGVMFYFCELDYPWEDGVDWCAAKGYQIARIDNAEENAGVAAAAAAVAEVAWYIGLSDHISDGQGEFAWNDGSPVEYTNWAGNEPNGDGRYACAHYRPGSAEWGDISCGNFRHFICREPD